MNTPSEDLASLIALIANEYEADYARISHYLYRAIYSMHFLDDGEVPRQMIQDTCFTLFQLADCFAEAGQKRYQRDQERIEQLLAELDILSGNYDAPAGGP